MYSSSTHPTDFEVSGHLVYAIISNIQSEEVRPMLQKQGLANIDVNQWYGATQLTNLFEEMARQPNFMANLVAIGLAAASLLIEMLPPELKAASLEQILMAEEELILSNYRNGYAGYIRVTKVDDHTYVHETVAAWPDDLNYGFVYAFVRHYCPKGKRFMVRKDPDFPGQDDGGELGRLIITLE